MGSDSSVSLTGGEYALVGLAAFDYFPKNNRAFLSSKLGVSALLLLISADFRGKTFSTGEFSLSALSSSAIERFPFEADSPFEAEFDNEGDSSVPNSS